MTGKKGRSGGWNKGVKAWNKGVKWPDEVKENISRGMIVYWIRRRKQGTAIESKTQLG